MKVLITGAAGFIGFHLCNQLLSRGDTVIGLDNLNDYYDVNLKKSRLENIKNKNFIFVELDLLNKKGLQKIFSEYQFDAVVNLAAQAGVRYSITNPDTYISSNVVGFLNVLESCRDNNIAHLLYASSSSVYGMNTKMPFSEADNVDHPVSLYAASKKSNELMAHSYSHLYNLPTSGLRFFTVYGPWGRPDMAAFLFTKAILSGQPIDVYNNGDMKRDFTYIDDIVDGIIRTLDVPPKANDEWSSLNPDPSYSTAPYRLFNIGNNSPVLLTEFIDAIEESLGINAIKNYLPIQPGDVVETYADIQNISKLGYAPSTDIQTGVKSFIDWYKGYYKIN
jgi:UDP-glucuronate 4-epimerase